VEGSGKSLTGIFLIILAYFLLLRSKALIPKEKPREEKRPTGDYR
jgi:hypothetical protein